MKIDNVMLYSGGLDSTVLLFKLKPNVRPLLFNYGQRHGRELDAAQAMCEVEEIDYQYVDLTDIRRLIAQGSQTGNEPVPEGHYADQSMKLTVVPNRNSIMLSIAVAHAITIQAHNVYFAAHAGDHAIYPDCRPEFVDAFSHAMHVANAWTPVEIHAPFIHMTKSDIVQEGARYGVPFDRTWSCYAGRTLHCGRCGTCVERREAFELAGVVDPTQYEEGAMSA